MGKVAKFVHDKSYQVIAFQAVNDVVQAIESARTLDGTYPKFTIVVEGSVTRTFEIPHTSVPEIIEVLKLSSADPED